MAPVRVQVRDRSGAVLPGVPVTLTLAAAPAGGVMLGTTTALTDVSGIATFAGLRFTVPGAGYRLRASATVPGSLVIPPALSVLFTILPLQQSPGEPASDPPVLAGAASNGHVGQTYVPLSFVAAPGVYVLRFYSNDSCPVSGQPGTLRFTRSVTVTSGSLVTTVVGDAAVAPGTFIVATAQNADENTSTLSNCVTVTDTNAVFWSASAGGNDHFYEYVNTPSPSWSSANAAASGRTLLGLKGHLVSITSAAENEVIRNLYLGMGLPDMRAWIGLTDPAGNFGWSWVTGEDFAYSNWSAGEPTGGGERWVEFFAAGVWNDNAETYFDNQGYAVEYEPEVLVGRLTDPAGDVDVNAGEPDLVSATVHRDGTDLIFRVRFASESFDADTTRAQLILDTDRTASTGHPGVNSGCVDDNGIIGAEFLVNLLGTSGTVLKYAGTCNSFTVVSTFSFNPVPGGFEIRLPLSVIEETDGALNFKVVTSTALGGGTFTGVLDYMSDVGEAVGTVGAGTTTTVSLGLTKTDSVDPVQQGVPFTYTLAVTNVGTTLASDVVIVDVIPAGLEVLGTSTTGRDCTLSPGELRCYVDTLGPGAIATVTLDVSATGAGLITNTASVTSSGFELTPADNAVSETTMVVTSEACSAPSFSGPFPYTAGPGTVTALSLTDMNHDGFLDAVTALPAEGGGGGVAVLLNDGTGQFGAPLFRASARPSFAHAVADFNGDGHPDVIVGETETPGGPTSLRLLLGDGTGALTLGGIAATPVSFRLLIAPFDLDGDGDQDVLTRGTAGDLLLLRNDGDGNFLAPVSLAAGPFPIAASVAVADFNEDGRPDLAVALAASAFAVLLADGVGGFGAPTTFPTTGQGPRYARRVI